MTKIDKWRRWMSNINDELIQLFGSRQIYREYGRIVSRNTRVDKTGAVFHRWVIDNYVTYIAMAIRRQADLDSHSISLAKLIYDIKEHPEALKRTDFVALYKNMSVDFAERDFSELAGKGEYMDSTIAQADYERLITVSKDVYDLASRSFAHKSTRVSPKVTFNDVDRCLEEIKSIAKKYELLMTGSSLEHEPVIAQDWQDIFLPWIEETDGN